MTVISEAVWRAKENNTDMSNFLNFEDIPDSRYDEESLSGWLYYSGRLAEIPKYLWGDLILESAACWDEDALQELTPENTSYYEQLVLLALAHGANRIQKINKHHLSEDLFIRICSEYPRCMEGINWNLGFGDFLTDKTIEAIASKSIFHYLVLQRVKSIDESKFSDDLIKTAIGNDLNNLLRLEGYGKEHLIAQVLSEGAWPDLHSMHIMHFAKLGLNASVPPESAEKAMEFLFASDENDTTYLYAMSIRTFPIESVIKAALERKNGLDLLFGHYTEAELRPHTKHYRALRGRMLENELGM
jgi:hypothetical protein